MTAVHQRSRPAPRRTPSRHATSRRRPIAAPTAPAAAGTRGLRLAGALAGVGVRTALLPRDASSRRRAQVCGAARILTALDVRVRVLAPEVAWPRSGGRLVVDGSAGWVDRLAVLTAVPRSAGGWSELADRALSSRGGAVAPAPVPADAGVQLPVVVRYLVDGEPLTGERLPRDLTAVLAARGLVVEVRLLPAQTAAGPAG